jgi:aminopeptidase N
MTRCSARAWECEFGPLARLRQPASPAHPGAAPRYAPDRAADIAHIKLDLDLDFDRRTLSGSASHDLRAVADPLERIGFDAVGLRVSKVLRDGRPAPFEVTDERIFVTVDPPLPQGGTARIEIFYSVTDPILGLYFIAPDEAYPDKPRQVWSQGQDEDSKHWFPCHDYPNLKSTSEMVVRVPPTWFALSNGRLVETREEGGRRLYHWRHDVPHASYLVTLVAGEFVEHREEWDTIPVIWYVPPGREADGMRSFGNTPRMVEFFSKRIGVRYPYDKYAQIAVADFVFGGMENTTATTQTDLTLHDERAHLDFSSDPLVAHELAHQWFGDLLTCRDWSHAWLNEGFATFFQALWREESEGVDEYRYDMLGKARSYFERDAAERRPVVCNVYEEPIDLFDAHIYEKGACVLHMLRAWLGDKAFFAGIRRYVETHRGDGVESQDLARAFQEATGRNVQRFFDQWVYRPGYPELECTWEFDAAKKRGILTVKQTQEGEPFWLPADVKITPARGEPVVSRVEVERKEQSFLFELPEAPRAVRFDDGGPILKKLKFKRPRALLEHQLRHDGDAMGRVEAALELGELGGREGVEALRTALLEDPFWGVRAEAASALGKVRSDDALEALLEGLRAVHHPKARRAVARALGGFRDERAARALAGVLSAGDPSYYVEAEAASALGQTKWEGAVEALRAAFAKDSHNDVIRTSACQGLAALERKEALEFLADWVAYGRPQLVRGAAFRAIGALGRALPDQATRAVDLLAPYARETFFRTRMNLIGAFRALGDDRAIPLLEGVASGRGDGRVRRAAREAIAAIRKGRDRMDDVRKIREDLDKLTEENRRLRDRVERLEKPPIKPRPKRKAKGRR